MRYIIILFVLFTFSGCAETVSKKEFDGLKKEVAAVKRQVAVMRVGVVHQLKEQEMFRVRAQLHFKSLFNGMTTLMKTNTRHFKQLYNNDRKLVKIIKKLHPKKKNKAKKKRKCTKRKCFPGKK